MKRKPLNTTAQNTETQRRKAVLYARVSTPHQQAEGYSLDAQLELLRSNADQKGLEVVIDIVEVGSASSSAGT